MAKRIICTTAPWAYGSTTTLITIARRLAGAARLTYMGGGISLECARRHAFDDFHEIDVLAPDFPRLCAPVLAEADAVLSVMNFLVPAPAHEVGTPCVLADGLGWMWNRARAPRTVARYFMERFPGLDENLVSQIPELPPYEITGPIVEDRWLGAHERTAQVMVNFSGLRQYLMPHEVERAYALGVWDAVLDAIREAGGDVLVTGGAELMSWLREATEPALRGQIRFASLGHEAFLQELDRSQALITAAGLRAIFEAFLYGVPCAFLPPQNMSQELTIQVLQAHGVACFADDWGSLYGLRSLTGRDQEEALREVNGCIERFADDRRGRARVTGTLLAFLRSPLADAVERQRAFMASLGENGAGRVAEVVAELAGVSLPAATS